MSDTQTEKSCLNLGSAEIKPDARVAYPEGLVLGVDEFVQEQRYFLEKDYLHNRGLHGYGTVYGLALGIARSETDDALPERTVSFDVDGNVWIKVSAGVGVDQRGRTFVLRETFCVNLTEWRQEHQADMPPVTGDEPVPQSIYIRARFDEICGDPAALAGKPCSTDAINSADSRIHDATLLELSLEKPAMAAWDLARRFAWFIAQIRVVPGIDRDTEAEQTLVNYVRQWLADDTYKEKFDALIQELVDAGKPPYFQLPEGTAETQQTLDALRLAYLTDVAPRAYGSPDPYAEKATEPENDVLLGQLDLEITPAANGKDEYISQVTLNEDERPYLLGTQVFQELLSASKRDKHRRRPFASLHVQGSKSVLLWLHHDDLKIPDELGDDKIILMSNGIELNGSISAVSGASGVFTVEPEDAIPVGARVEMVFNLDNLTDQNDALLDLSAFNEYVGLNDDGTIITVYTFADNLPDVRPFALVSAHRPTRNGAIILDVWLTAAGTITVEDDPLSVKDGNTLDDITVTLDTSDTHVWHITLPEDINDKDRLVLRFDTQKISLDNYDLQQAMNLGQYAFSGYDGMQYIDLAYIVDLPTTFSKTDIEGIVNDVIEADVPGVVDEHLKTLRTLPFATITPIMVNSVIVFEMWFHSSLTGGQQGGAISFIDNSALAVYAERGNTITGVAYSTAPNAAHANVINLTPTNQADDLAYLRFVFLPSKIQIGNQSLQQLMDKNQIKFDGYFVSLSSAGNVIIVYVRNQLPPIQQPQINALKAEADVPVKAARAKVAKPRSRKAGGKG